jgi:Fe-S cluster assembly protein SufD
LAESSMTLESPDVITPEGVTERINRAAVETVAAGEPEWLRNRRLEAWASYERTPMPTTRLEEWRYTDLSRKLKLDGLAPVGLDGASVPFDGELPGRLEEAMEADWDASGHLIEMDGSTASTDLLDDLASSGVVLSSLRDAVQTHPELLDELLATQALPAGAGKFQALNAALWTDGIFLYVPKGVRMELPVRAQPGSAPALGAGGPGFESRRPDWVFVGEGRP